MTQVVFRQLTLSPRLGDSRLQHRRVGPGVDGRDEVASCLVDLGKGACSVPVGDGPGACQAGLGESRSMLDGRTQVSRS